MEREKNIKLSIDFLNNSNNYQRYNYNLSDRQIYFKQQPEIIIKNLEPKDNMKRANRQQLINLEKEQKFGNDLEKLKINENKQIIENNIFEKNNIKCLSELNTKKTYGFFNKEKEKNNNKEDIIKNKDYSLFNGKENIFNSKNYNITDNKINELQVLSIDSNNRNNNIEFNDNKFIHIKKKKMVNLIKNNILEENDIIDNSSKKKIFLPKEIQNNFNDKNQYTNIKIELNTEKLPLDNMRNKLRRKEIKTESENKINPSHDDKIRKFDKRENTMELVNENKIQIEIEEKKNLNISPKDNLTNKSSINEVFDIKMKNIEEKNEIFNKSNHEIHYTN